MGIFDFFKRDLKKLKDGVNDSGASVISDSGNEGESSVDSGASSDAMGGGESGGGASSDGGSGGGGGD